MKHEAMSFPSLGRLALGVGIILAGWVVLSLALLQTPAPGVRMAAIQPAVSTLLEANRGHEDLAWQTLLRIREQSLEAARQGAQYIVWPEGVFFFDPPVEDRLEFTFLPPLTALWQKGGH